jgi:peptidoglycan/LPS O-acetylase OafA/YrhL
MNQTTTAPRMYEVGKTTKDYKATSIGKRNVAIGYLRAFVTLLVLAHHSVLAYHPEAPPLSATLAGPGRWWQAFPVVDSQRWAGFGLLVGFNELFFMSLMFLLSGLFVWKSLERKGSPAFLRDRLIRLGLPFVVAAGVVAPVAYYPAFLQTGATSGIAGFWRQWVSLGNWPAGPAWFIWLLLAFDCVAVLLFAILPRWGEAIGRLSSNAACRPFAFFGLLIALSAATYIPMEFIFNGFSWASFGPFTFQTSRLLHYFVYFAVGVGIGAFGIERGLLSPDGKLARRWFAWSLAALLIFFAAIVVIIMAITTHGGTAYWRALSDSAFVISCATTSFALLAVFVRFAKRSAVWNSLSDNAYGMYLIHYPFVSWLQYALLKTQMPAFAKGSIVFLGTMLLSWGVIAGIRRMPAVARVI